MTSGPGAERGAGQPTRIPTPARALTIGAHPDDAEFGAGGTIAGWAADGCAVTMLVVTDGSKGTWDRDLDPAELIRIRREEQRAAAEILGVGDVVFLDHVDGELLYSMRLREELCGWIRRIGPDAVLSHDPWRRYMLHPDHRAVGWGVVDGVVAARDHLYFAGQIAGGLTPHRPEWLLLWGADEPDFWVDISGTIDQKIDALLRHASQGSTTMSDAHDHPDKAAEFRKRVISHAEEQGRRRDMKAAEAFKLIRP